jgi:CBS domain-containing membrane protein
VSMKLIDRFGTKGDALYAFVACLLALAMSGVAAYVFKQPLLFPSLGPAALLFFEQPMAAPSSPRNTLIGHLVAILAILWRKSGRKNHP